MRERTLKIGVILYQLLVSGGTERQAICFARELIRRGHTVTLYAFKYDKARCYPELCRELRVVSLPKKYASVREGARALARLIDKDTDLLNPHEQIPLRVAYYFRRRIRLIPSVLMINDLFLAQWSLARELSGARASLVRRGAQWLKDQWGKSFFDGGADEFAVLNQGTADMLEFYLGLKSVVVRSGIDASAFPFVLRSMPHGRCIRLLCHALFFRHRRFEDAIGALARIVKEGIDAELIISGSYTHKKDARAYYDELTTLAETLGVSWRVIFKGVVSDAELLELYRTADVFLFPSHKQTWGLAVFEAMASGLPVIVSRSAGASEILTDYENALLSNPCSSLSIAVLLKQLLSSPALYEKLSREGRAFVEQNLSWAKYTDAMLALFEKASASHARYLFMLH